MTKTILLLSIASLLGGCSLWGGKTFQCPGASTKGATCLSARQVYEATHVTDHLTPNYRDGKPIAPDERAAEAHSHEGTPASAGAPQALLNTYLPPLPEADSPLPVRTPPKVMRIRIFPWEDNSRDLNTGGFVFTEIEGRVWTLGDDQVSRVQANVITPLALPKATAMGGQNQSPLSMPSQASRPRLADPQLPPSQRVPAVPPAGQAPAQSPAQFRTP